MKHAYEDQGIDCGPEMHASELLTRTCDMSAILISVPQEPTLLLSRIAHE